MKKLFLLTIIGMFLISCGGGGWSEEDQTKAMEECEQYEEKEACECYLDALMGKFDSYEDSINWMEELEKEYEEAEDNDDKDRMEELEEEAEEMTKWWNQVDEDCTK